MELDRIKSLVVEINEQYQSLSSLSNDELRVRYSQLRNEAFDKLQHGISEKEILDSALIEVFALLKEVTRRFSENDEIKVEQTNLDVKLFENVPFIKDCKKDPNDSTDQSYLWSLNYVSSWFIGNEMYKWNVVLYDEQLMGGIALHEGKIIQMCTGEGKTFVSIAPVLLNALLGKCCHIMTANSYLSKRDYEITRPIYSFFGLTVGCIENKERNSNALREAYKSDVVFGATSNFIFDYLYDMMNNDLETRVQGMYDFAILDEADSMLIDEASTPHIISSCIEQVNTLCTNKLFVDYLPFVKELVENNQDGQYCIINKIKHFASYTETGKKWLREKLADPLLFEENVVENNEQVEKLYFDFSQEKKEALLESQKIQVKYRKQQENVLDKLLHALTVYFEDEDYVVAERNNKKSVIIIDSNTGRLKEQSRWEYGLHEAIEAKEGIEVGGLGYQTAVISIKNYLRKYSKISGMTGTAVACSKELKEVYNLSVLKIPTHRPVVREDLPLRVFRNQKLLDEAVINKAIEIPKKGRSVLVCTATIKRSTLLADKFAKRDIEVQVLNGKTLAEEASLVANAGKSGFITISTSVAGRGTDIKPDEDVLAKGGLAVLGVELAHSDRIDQQMAGRAGRQGNPGSSQFFVSLDDDILAYLSEKEKKSLTEIVDNCLNDKEIISKEICDFFYLAQQNCVHEEMDRRKKMNLRDDSIDSFRNEIYGIKDRILKDSKEADAVLKELYGEGNDCFGKEHYAHVMQVLSVAMPIIRKIQENTYVIDSYQRLPLSDGNKVYSIPFSLNSALKTDGSSLYASIEKYVLLDAINKSWMNYINEIDSDNLIPADLYTIFLDTKKCMLEDVENRLTKLYIPVNAISGDEENDKKETSNPLLKYIKVHSKKVEMLEPCPCGSGKAFWQCHGKNKLK